MDEIKGNIEDNRSTEDLPTPPDGVRVEGSQPVGGVIPPAAPEPLAPAGAPAGSRAGQILAHRSTGWFVAVLLVGVIAGLSVALANSSQTPFVRVPVGVAAPVRVFQFPRGGVPLTPSVFPQGSARLGTVDSVGSSSFTMTTFSGQKVTVVEQSSTVYRKAVRGVGAKSALKKGDRVFVVGPQNGSTVKAAEILVLPANSRFGPVPAWYAAPATVLQ